MALDLKLGGYLRPWRCTFSKAVDLEARMRRIR